MIIAHSVTGVKWNRQKKRNYFSALRGIPGRATVGGMTKPTMGRPRGRTLTEKAATYLSPRDMARLVRAADKAHQPVALLMRGILLDWLQRQGVR